MIPRRTLTFVMAAGLLMCAILACSADDLAIGRRPEAPTATAPVFSTTTPGGVISVWLATPVSGLPAAPTQVQLTPAGSIVEPVGTATAAAALVNTATAEALVTPARQATYQPGECPPPGNPPPPTRPVTFIQYPQAIAQYLSAGGPTTLLEAALRNWGAVTESGGLVKVDTDITGDRVIEVIITIYDPVHADAQSQPGQLLIFGCDQGSYRLLYASPADPHIGLPVLLRVGDMNGDARAEIAFQIQRCDQPSVCVGEAQILSWDSTLGSFQPLNAGLISAAAAQFGIADVDEDGILELIVTSGASAGTGPPRATTQIWDWNGQSYLLAFTETTHTQYRIHVLHDGDAALDAGNYPDARAAYNRALTDESLLSWTLPNERAHLNAYALYRLVLTYAVQNDITQAQAAFDRLATQYTAGAPGQGYAAMGIAFWNEYAPSRSISAACALARGVAASRPEILAVLNSYGTANRQYTVNDMCPY